VSCRATAPQAPVNYIDETPWYCDNALEWLWVMASERVAFSMIHPRRSKEAFAALIDDWGACWSAMALGCRKAGWRHGKPAWRIWYARRGAWRCGSTPSWPLAAPGRWWSCNSFVRWQRPQRLGEPGACSMTAFCTSSPPHTATLRVD